VSRPSLSALAVLATPLYRAYFATLRLRGLLADGTTLAPAQYAYGPEIFALCECDAVALAGLIAHTRLTALVALGRDGDWASGILARLGFGLVRGSSLRGGAGALAHLIRAMRASDAPGAIVVDGPLGPPGEAKPGIVLCAQRTGRPIRALGVAARPKIVFRRTWSQIFFPLPFSRVVIACEEPLTVPATTDREGIATLALELTGRLATARQRAQAALGAMRTKGRIDGVVPAYASPSTSAETCAGTQPTSGTLQAPTLGDRR